MSEKSEFTFSEKITNASAITVTDILLTLSLSNRFRRFTVIQFNTRQDVLWLAHFKRQDILGSKDTGLMLLACLLACLSTYLARLQLCETLALRYVIEKQLSRYNFFFFSSSFFFFYLLKFYPFNNLQKYVREKIMRRQKD